jgi:hypothetical protein
MKERRFKDVLGSTLLPGLLLVFASCSSEWGEMFFKSADDPYAGIPRAECFERENVIKLTWSKDDGCDEYVLMRAEDNSISLNFKEIYRGNALYYEDKDGEEWKRYLYRLDKTRGNKYFKGNETVMALCSPVRGDEYEDNDSEDKAVLLESDRSANIYRCVFEDGRVFEDFDWYYVEIPPHRVACLTLEDSGIAVNEHTTAFCYLLPGDGVHEIKQNTEFLLYNRTEEKKKVYIKIFANPSLFESTGSGSFVRSYVLSLYMVRKE